jgi:hypothetical protein
LSLPIGFEIVERHVSKRLTDAFDRLDKDVEMGVGGVLGHQNTGTAVASIRWRRNLWMLSRVIMSVLRPRILAAASFTSINSKRPELTPFIVEEEVNVGLIARLVARGRPEEVKMQYTEALELRLMVPQ